MYDDLLDFIYFINKDYSQFFQNVMFGLSKFCGYPINAYVIYDMDEERNVLSVNRALSDSVHEKYMQDYQKRTYSTDLFLTHFIHGRQKHSLKYVLTIPDIASYEEYYATEHGKAMLRRNLPYRATIYDSNADYPLHLVAVFKTGEQGAFDAEELEFLNYVGGAFCRSAALYKKYVAAAVRAKFLDTLVEGCPNMPGELAVIRKDEQIAYNSPRFFSLLSSRICDMRNGHAIDKHEALTRLKEALSENGEFNFFSVTETMNVDLGQLNLRVMPRMIDDGESVNKYAFLFISEKSPNTGARKATAKFIEIAEKKYSFTYREAEVAELMAAGYDNSQIAAFLYVNNNTIKYHLVVALVNCEGTAQKKCNEQLS
jgi:hypothetical protein